MVDDRGRVRTYSLNVFLKVSQDALAWKIRYSLEAQFSDLDEFFGVTQPRGKTGTDFQDIEINFAGVLFEEGCQINFFGSSRPFQLIFTGRKTSRQTLFCNQ